MVTGVGCNPTIHGFESHPPLLFKMEKIVYLVHGWGGSDSSEAWFGWLKKELLKKGFEIISFNMPNTDEPKIEEWVGYLKKNVKSINEKTYFIGHSIGCQAVLRYLETLKASIKINGVILVAPWIELDSNTIKEEGQEVIEIAKPWIETPINFKKIKTHTSNFLSIFSDNDPYVSLKEVKKFKENLNSETIVKKSEEHFNSTEKIPEILKFIK